MSHENHVWRKGKSPPLIRQHSLRKHLVLRQYLERYVSVLTANPRQDQFRLTLIDGFSGGGSYIDDVTGAPQSGSPLIMLEAMEQAQQDAQAFRIKPFSLDVQYLFIDADPEAINYLRDVLVKSRFAKYVNKSIHIFNSDFVSKVPEILKFVKSRGRADRAIFVLDQFGYSNVPFPTIRSILSKLENAEILLTFATDYLIDYLSEDGKTQQILENVGLKLSSGTIRTAKQERDWRRIIQFHLQGEIPLQSGAPFYTPFYIRSADAHRDFWLLHLSQHFRAKDVMVDVHWRNSTSFAHYGRSGLNMLGYDQDDDPCLTGQGMLAGFFFDDTARASSKEQLFQELPERIFGMRDGIPFSDLFAKLTNECPVTAEIMKEVLADLHEEGMVRVTDKSSDKQRRKGIQHDSDIIIPSRQKRFFIKRPDHR